jgi:uncharacterized protein YbaP (TraB family)
MLRWEGCCRLLVALLLTAPGAAAIAAERQCPPAPAELTQDVIGELAAQARDRGFLWKLSKDGHDSWLYGTLHVGKQDWAMPGPKIVDALRRSDLLALELDVGDAATLETLGAIYRRGAGQIPESLQGRFKAQLDRVCLPESAMNDMNPLLLLTTVELLLGRERGLEAGYGVEFVLSAYAHSAGKKVAALETAEGQMASMLPADGIVGAAALDESLQHLEHADSLAILDQVADVWAHGDLAALNRYEKWCDCMETPIQRAEMKKLLDDRNGPLAEAIDALHLQGKPVFVAVGALHMVGSKGLPALLAGKGYTVTRVEFTP